MYIMCVYVYMGVCAYLEKMRKDQASATPAQRYVQR